ncbi:hypothetical protein CEW91_11900 [Idiomarina piscisalsi]|uniref:Uncharacterized protein n=1 Tax=Idiomarina piscisalsi TaxID=1096243 RepID=A0ABM6LW92_9GAMM|nr:hypothetical protein [Idiomarina piscisalsi]ASG66795.1 hypothetical protein CEW91_11900 [Idiomarina piscisalsi]
MQRLINWLKTLSAIPLALGVIFLVLLPSILMSTLIVGLFDLLFLELVWMSWTAFWWVLGTWVVIMLIALANSADKILFGIPK